MMELKKGGGAKCHLYFVHAACIIGIWWHQRSAMSTFRTEDRQKERPNSYHLPLFLSLCLSLDITLVRSFSLKLFILFARWKSAGRWWYSSRVFVFLMSRAHRAGKVCNFVSRFPRCKRCTHIHTLALVGYFGVQRALAEIRFAMIWRGENRARKRGARARTHTYTYWVFIATREIK